MSGPKEGHYRNYQVECENLKRRIDSTFNELKKLERDIQNFTISGSEQQLGLEFSRVDLIKEKEIALKNIAEAVNYGKTLLDQALRVSIYNERNLTSLTEINQKILEIRDRVIKLCSSFRLKVNETLKKSAEQAEKLRISLISEIESYLKSEDFEVINQWVSEKDQIERLKDLLNQAKREGVKEVEKIHGQFLSLFEKLKDTAVKNKENFELKKDTSSKIMKILSEQNYVNIERKLESDKLGAVVIVAESPSGGWNLTFKVENDGEIKVVTPYSERCYSELEQIGESLRKVGVDITIKQLEERKKLQSGKGQVTKVEETSKSRIQQQ